MFQLQVGRQHWELILREVTSQHGSGYPLEVEEVRVTSWPHSQPTYLLSSEHLVGESLHDGLRAGTTMQV